MIVSTSARVSSVHGSTGLIRCATYAWAVATPALPSMRNGLSMRLNAASTSVAACASVARVAVKSTVIIWSARSALNMQQFIGVSVASSHSPDNSVPSSSLKARLMLFAMFGSGWEFSRPFAKFTIEKLRAPPSKSTATSR